MKSLIKTRFLIALLLLTIPLLSCGEVVQVKAEKGPTKSVTLSNNNKIRVLNLGTFHMGPTSDANSTEFDQYSDKNRREANKIAKDLSVFRPTVIVVETQPKYNDDLKAEYDAYVKNPDKEFESPSEIELIAFELGRLSGTERIIGIDHKMEYDYGMIDSMANSMSDKVYLDYMKNIGTLMGEDFERQSLIDKLRTLNTVEMLDFAIEVNADILSHVATEGNFEGADEAAKYYQRNLRMYSNLNQVPLTAEDRIFILMGTSHTAFFRDFFSRSPKYEMVDTFKYLGR